MKERPILFSAPMVRAILAGQKTQTRRIVKHAHVAEADAWAGNGDGTWQLGVYGEGGVAACMDLVRCPYGVPGDRLWVREMWCLAAPDRDCHLNGEPQAWRPRRDDGRWAYYAATDDDVVNVDDDNRSPWKPSIHMPRWASRLTLQVTSLRVERLQDISELDALAEGIEGRVVDGVLNGEPGRYIVGTARDAFASLWDSINGERAPWSSNPWVWAIEFSRLP